MARPVKCRKVCRLPQYKEIGATDKTDDGSEVVIMPIDEYEVIRLIDLEGLTQAECALKMQVARTTVQRIYNDSREKLAQMLVLGKRIVIKGGEYQLCEHKSQGCQHCKKQKSGAYYQE